jgi:hypothetical protein
MKGVPLLAGLNLVPRLGSAQQPCPGETRALKNRREWESAPPGNPKKKLQRHTNMAAASKLYPLLSDGQ